MIRGTRGTHRAPRATRIGVWHGTVLGALLALSYAAWVVSLAPAG